MVVVVSLVLSMLGAARPSVSVANFQRLTVGMTEKQVEKLFGRAGEPCFRATFSTYRVWKCKDAFVHLEFAPRRLVEGSCHDAKGMVYEVRLATVATEWLNLLVSPWPTWNDGGIDADSFERLFGLEE